MQTGRKIKYTKQTIDRRAQKAAWLVRFKEIAEAAKEIGKILYKDQYTKIGMSFSRWNSIFNKGTLVERDELEALEKAFGHYTKPGYAQKTPEDYENELERVRGEIAKKDDDIEELQAKLYEQKKLASGNKKIIKELKAELDRLEKENEKLAKKLKPLPPTSVDTA